jgi:hypothetical protein
MIHDRLRMLMASTDFLRLSIEEKSVFVFGLSIYLHACAI